MVATRDVVAYIKKRLSSATDMQLYKLAYYVQAWNIAWEGRPMFDERIEAWRHGPVPVDYRAEQKFGTVGVARSLPDDAREVVDAVLDYYGHMTAAQLRKLSHEDDPWQEARGGIPDDAPSSEPITVASMRRYYTRKSLLGGDVPVRASRHEVMTTERVLEIARRQFPRWPGTLARLADR